MEYKPQDEAVGLLLIPNPGSCRDACNRPACLGGQPIWFLWGAGVVFVGLKGYCPVELRGLAYG
ncbi:hypothetical protein ACFX5L_02320 [Bacteroides sp. KG123]|uniref:hypothetical protein n=1 Tax=unclassified Bacteroides TaxID=2646097 RepID=UPI003D7F964A